MKYNVRMKTAAAVGVVILAGTGGAAVFWFWSLGWVAPGEPPVRRLIVTRGTATLTDKDTGVTRRAMSGTMLKDGDSVNTNARTKAVIVSEDRELLGLDEKTAALIQGAYYPCPPSLVIKLKPQEVKAALAPPSPGTAVPGTAADRPMVRGTSFLVLPASLPMCLTLVQENQAPSVPARTRRPSAAGKVSPCDTGEGNTVDGQAADVGRGNGRITPAGWDGLREAFKPPTGISLPESIQRWISEESMAGAGIGLEGATYPFFVWSEAFRLKLSGQDAPGLYSLYLERHFNQVRDLMRRGKADLADKILTQTISGLDRRLAGPEAQGYRSGIRAALGQAAFAADSSATEFLPMKHRLEEAYVRAWTGDPREEAWARALLTDARLSQAEEVVCDPWYVEPLANPVGSAEQAFNRLTEDLNVAVGDKALWNPVRELADSERTRLTCLKDYLKSCQPKPGEARPAPAETAPSRPGTAPSVQPPTSRPADVTQQRDGAPAAQLPAAGQPETPAPPMVPEVQPEPSLGLAFIMINAQPNPARLGDSVDLSVKGVKNDGSQLDVTNMASFSLSGNTGTLSGHTFQTAQYGATTITATVSDGGRDFTDSVMLNVVQPGSSRPTQNPGFFAAP